MAGKDPDELTRKLRLGLDYVDKVMDGEGDTPEKLTKLRENPNFTRIQNNDNLSTADKRYALKRIATYTGLAITSLTQSFPTGARNKAMEWLDHYLETPTEPNPANQLTFAQNHAENGQDTKFAQA